MPGVDGLPGQALLVVVEAGGAGAFGEGGVVRFVLVAVDDFDAVGEEFAPAEGGGGAGGAAGAWFVAAERVLGEKDCRAGAEGFQFLLHVAAEDILDGVSGARFG
ncbi:hypothetical protein [Streptomyces sp. NPDC014894]|uniref:hypothetical protein n=1 Tax=Streptomyces sp. NPDC014894 TaxID=3364931 RepID=UPI0036F84529